MPLHKGSTPDIISANIGELMRAGHAAPQAAAIAYKASQGQDAAAGVLYRVGDSVLLLLRAANSENFPLHWGLPGGGVEQHETAEQAAVRECQEEIGYTPIDALYPLDYDEGFTTFGLNLAECFVPTLNNEHLGYCWAPLNGLPQPLHPGVAATLATLPAIGQAMDAREYDSNGWFEVEANPISRAGIFPYSGRQLGLTGPDADRIFQVLRPPEELADAECIDSFKLLPWIDDHVMLGPVAQQVTDKAVDTDKKGIKGIIGERVFFKEGTLYANIKAFSATLAALIAAGKRELSAGYRCVYEISSGVWNGLHYDAIQRKIRGNHLALVNEGRMGPGVAVMDGAALMDRFTFTFDAKELEMADGKDEGGEGTLSLADISAAIKAFGPIAAQVAEMQKTLSGMAAPAAPADAAGKDEGAPAAAGSGAHAAVPPAAPAKKEGDGGEGTPAGTAMDERAFVARIAQRDTLAKQISAHVGTFDHAAMTLDDVVKYGCEKFEIKAVKGQEAAMLSGYLQARPAKLPSATVTGMDAANPSQPAAGNFVTKHLKGA